ncbi:uncharacterized protein C8R40DRAFT_1176871 [Lentinula edodes]|uniref:uncharacterized protein n=1 Tax=Lentinula edodes TaxID=5353 RepID=UPI001E8E78EA|nr:uncharacterized protein C8R40DRAFT_1176871 [Lentinula edodes]KAH7869221.1 hypothetical protein C8R40DRAFT_1176871 [Lentinula edodes]
MDQLAFTIESLSRPQLQLFETVFNTGKPLSGYCQDDPLWPLLAEVASPCSNCVKSPGKCKVLLNSPCCTNCSAKKTCSLGKVLRYRYFTHHCSQDIAYSRRFLELHGTPIHQSTWGIPLSTWHQYDAALQARTSSTSTLLELNMLDKQDTAETDQQEFQKFLALQQGEAVVAAKCKRNRSPLPVAGPSSKKVRLDGSKKCSRRRTPVEGAAQESPRHIRLVVPPGHSMAASTSTPALPRAPPSSMEVSVRDEPVQGPSGLVQLAAAAEVQSGVVQRLVSPSPVMSPIKGIGSDPLPSNMPPTSRSLLVPRTLIAHPYRAENQHLLAWVRSLESQLADSQQENSSLTTALQDTSHALDARQWEVEQLRSSSHEVLQHKVEYRSVLDQFHALDRALSVFPGQTVVQRLQALEEELRVVKRDRDIAASELKTALLQQQGLVDETNALATHQRRRLEEFREEAHHTRDRATFVEQMIKEYPDEGFYEVVLPPLSQLEEDLLRVATFAHCLYRSNPTTVLHHHSRYIGAIIEAVIAFLRRGLDSDVPDVIAHNFQLALDYMQTARGIHGDLYMWSISSIQWFFNNAVDEDEGLHRLVLEHSRFDNDGPFLTAAQHAGSAAPPEGSMEPPLHRRMLVLSTAFPHQDGSERWDNVVPAIPSLDQSMVVWEQLMLEYLHHITDTPMSVPVPSDEPPSAVGEGVSSLPASSHVPLFLPEQDSPTSPSPPPPSPSLPLLFGSVADLAIDLTGGDDELYEPEESHRARVSEVDGMDAVPKEELL